MEHNLTPSDIMSMDEYGVIRKNRAKALAASKKNRRVEVGPSCTFYFENFDTMWFQIHEMLFIEKGGKEQIPGELAAYNPLIPKGKELVATVMIEVGDPGRRAILLSKLGGFEETISLFINEEKVNALPETDIDRITSEGKASSVQFVRFPFNEKQIAAFCSKTPQILLTVGHPEYHHMAGIPKNVHEALIGDFDYD